MEPNDEDIAEAMRLAGFTHHHDRVLQVRDDPQSWHETIAHARTLAKLRVAEQREKELEARLRVAVGAFENITDIDPDDTERFHDIANAALAQIRDTDHDAD